MGSIAAMSSLDRVLEMHEDELYAAYHPCKPGTKLTYQKTWFENNLYSLTVGHVFLTEDGREVTILGEAIDIDTLAEKYPDCEVGY